MSEPVVLSGLALAPVVELEPATFRRHEVDVPSGSQEQDPAGWQRYWSESLADAGIGHLRPIQPGSWLVSIEELVESHALDVIVEAHLSCALADPGAPTSMSDLQDQVAALPGGFVLRDASGDRIEPRCCCTLEDLTSWREVADRDHPDWETMWIGHPWASARWQGARALLRLETEHGPPPEPGLFAVDRAELAAAVRAAHGGLMRFAERLLPAVSHGLARREGPLDAAPWLAGVLAGHVESRGS